MSVFSRHAFSDEIAEMRRNMRTGFQLIKEELDNYLETINRNTEEVESSYDFLLEVDRRLDKLSERLDRLEWHLNPYKMSERIELSLREQEVFMVLYMASDRVSIKDMARRLSWTEEMVENHVSTLLVKHIPVRKEFTEDTCWVVLDPAFKELQAKRGVILVSEEAARSVEALTF